jgi:hypothetical protein
MTKLKLIAMTAVAAVAIGVGGLVAAPSASAARYSCSQALTMSQMYIAFGDIFMSMGHVSMAASYYGRASGVVEASC